MAKGNGSNGIVKLMTTIIVSGVAGTLITVGIVYATLCGGVEVNKNSIKEIKEKVIPKVEGNKEDIIGMKKDIAQILETQNKMIEEDKENTKAIIKAIEGLKRDGN